MEKLLISRNDKAISERMADYKHVCERINTAILAVLGTGVKLADSQLVKVLDADFLTEEADRQARQEAQQRSSFAFTGASIDTRQLCAKLEEVSVQIAKEVRAVKVRLDYFIFKDGRATLYEEKLQAALEDKHSIYADNEVEAETWRLMQTAKTALDALLVHVAKHGSGVPYHFAPLIYENEWGKVGLITLHKGYSTLNAESVKFIR